MTKFLDIKPLEVELCKIYRSYLRSNKEDFKEDFVSRLEVLETIDKKIEQLITIQPEFRKKYADTILYDLKRSVIELPAYELRKYGSQIYTGAMYKCDHCGYEVMPWNNTPYCQNC